LVGDMIVNMSYVPILSNRYSITIPPSSCNVSNDKESIKKISQMDNEIKLAFSAHDLSPDGISMEDIKKFVQTL